MPHSSLTRRMLLATTIGMPSLVLRCQTEKNIVVERPGRRKALVIGNQRYPLYRLTYPVVDATTVRDALRDVGFFCTIGTDLKLTRMVDVIGEFVQSLRAGDDAVFYFSGHACQFQGENILCPLDFDFRAKNPATGYFIGPLLNRLSNAKVRTQLIILDGCRTNTPFDPDNRGLAQMAGPEGSFIAFATQPLQTADDDGKYAACLANLVREPGLEINDLFRGLRQCLNRPQTPPTWSNLRERFYFRPRPDPPTVEIPATDYPKGPFRITRARVSYHDYRQMFPQGGAGAARDGSAINVSWEGANAFCQSMGGRLPLESEWEAAARFFSSEGLSVKIGEWCQDEYRVQGQSTGERVIRGLDGPGSRDRGVEGKLAQLKQPNTLNVGFRIVFPATVRQ